METVIQSRSKTVVIGPEQPFCIIGERINPTGRKAFQALLQAGDLSQLEIDVPEQVAGGADMLDVNVGDPLADEVALMGEAVRLVQGLTDLPLCLDSSVIEALEAGLDAYEGKALVNSVTGEDERLEAILPLVAKHGAAVIGLANDEDIPMEPEVRLAVAKKIVSAAGDHGIPPEDVVIDALAMPVGALPNAVTLFVETLALIREHLGVNTTCGASNTAFGLPRRTHAGRRVPLDRAEPRADERDHGLTRAGVCRRRAGGRPPARQRRVGRALDRIVPREAGGRGIVSAAEILPVLPQKDRVLLRFEPTGDSDAAPKEARVPAGTTLFDAASWNGIAIDSTCGGHGTCKKCKVRVVEGKVPLSSVDPRAFSIEELKAGWRLACRAPAEEDLVVEVPPLSSRPKAALVGVGRHVILRPAVQKRYLELEEPTLEDQALRPRARAGGDGRRRAARAARGRAHARRHAARRRLQGHRRSLRRPVARRRAGRHYGADLRDRVRSRDDHRRREPARPRDRLAARGPVPAEQAAAVRRRRDLARLGHDARPRCALAPAEPRARDAGRARAGGVRGGRSVRRARSTRSRSPATRR